MASEETYSKSKDYWEGVEPTLQGMLGGFEQISAIDTQTSFRFLSNFFSPLEPVPSARGPDGDQHRTKKGAPNKGKRSRSPPSPSFRRAPGAGACPSPHDSEAEPRHALDCGAGIGRVTKHLLLKFCDKVDLLEQNRAFLDKAREHISPAVFDERVGQLICSGLHEFKPDPEIRYDLIWCQWVTGYLTEDHFVRFLKTCKSILKQPHGLIVIKDNHTSSEETDDDTSDSSVTRPYSLLVEIFEKAGLTIVSERRQYKFPKGLYPVKMFALK